ncbi:ABC transporter substrate-binding protein [Paenibacillus sp. FJAT-26967]|uniref:ABC transporter substrate-binding protein n=1 Tax=Paenibacillus sp. FJAT-26967 TaxID=1729690 RepID=UPI0008389996|nr:ABC transporter substrate-binding protein [Paenibacillus sp. FJAT-26967]
MEGIQTLLIQETKKKRGIFIHLNKNILFVQVHVICTILILMSTIGCANHVNDEPQRVLPDSNVPKSNPPIIDNDVRIEGKATPYPLNVQDACGSNLFIEREPERVVIQGVREKEFLIEAGAEDKMIVFEGKGIGGSIHETERRIAAETKPDLVILIGGEGSCESAGALAKLGIPSYVSDQSTVKRIARELLTTGIVLNTRESAEEASDRLLESIRNVEESVSSVEQVSVYWETGLQIEFEEIKGYSALGPGALEHDMLTLAGGINITQESARNPYRIIKNLDSIIQSDPDHILISGYERQASREFKEVVQREGWDSLQAVKSGRVKELPASFGSVRTLSSDLCLLSEILHPQISPSSAQQNLFKDNNGKQDTMKK